MPPSVWCCLDRPADSNRVGAGRGHPCRRRVLLALPRYLGWWRRPKSRPRGCYTQEPQGRHSSRRAGQSGSGGCEGSPNRGWVPVSALAAPLVAASAAGVTAAIGLLDPVLATSVCIKQRRNPWFREQIVRQWLGCTFSPLARQTTLRSIAMVAGSVWIAYYNLGQEAPVILRSLYWASLPIGFAICGIWCCVRLGGFREDIRNFLFFLQAACVWWSAIQAAGLAAAWAAVS